jgi:putative transposase
MSSHTQILYQIVFCTKDRENALTKENRPELYKYIWGVMEEKKCHLYRINGVEDHLHIATHVHPTISLSDLIKSIKVSSSVFIKERGLFPRFKNWQDGYGAFTYSIKEKEALVAYIKNQEIHHEKVSFRDEYVSLLTEHGIAFDERYLI